jgi:hypothetical protein
MNRVHTESYVRPVVDRPNANTRWVTAGPRLESAWLDEAYARARSLETDPMTAAGVRLVWWRSGATPAEQGRPGNTRQAEEIGWHDLAAHPKAFALVGRHTHCDLVLPSDGAVALRHLMVRATTLDDGTPAVRVLDLRTGLGFHLDDDVERRALVATGVVALRIGRYALVALPSGAELPDARPQPEVIESTCVPTQGRPSTRFITSVTTMPPAPRLDDIARDVAGPGRARITLRRGDAWATVDVPDAALDAGILVGRADRCETRVRPVLTESVSRVHVLVLREHGVVHAFDTASTQGTYADGERVRRVRLPDDGGTLRLASKDPVLLEWHPRAPVA